MSERVRNYNNDSIGMKALLYGAGILAVVGMDYGLGMIADNSNGVTKASEFAEASGYHDPELLVVDKLFVGLKGCDQNDEVRYEFKARGANEKTVLINVCAGLFKGMTVRSA